MKCVIVVCYFHFLSLFFFLLHSFLKEFELHCPKEKFPFCVWKWLDLSSQFVGRLILFWRNFVKPINPKTTLFENGKLIIFFLCFCFFYRKFISRSESVWFSDWFSECSCINENICIFRNLIIHLQWKFKNKHDFFVFFCLFLTLTETFKISGLFITVSFEGLHEVIWIHRSF